MSAMVLHVHGYAEVGTVRDARCQWCRRGLRERRRAERQYARVARGTQGDETPLCSRLRFGRAESPHTFSSTSTSCKSRRERSRAEGREEVRCQDGASYSCSQSVIYFTVPPHAHPSITGAGLQNGAFLRFTIRRGAVRHVVGRFHIGHRVARCKCCMMHLLESHNTIS